VPPNIQELEAVLACTPVFSRLALRDRRTIAEAATLKRYHKGQTIFVESAAADAFYTIASGRVKIFKTLPSGKDVILEVFGQGDPLGAIAAYDGRPFPASAVALEDTTCVVIARDVFFRLLEQHPSLVRGLMLGLTIRLTELTNRLATLSGARVEPRLARVFLKMADEMGRPDGGGTSIPLALSRQELADLSGTTIETAIRIMSRWGKAGIVRTVKDGFVIADRARLEEIGAE
jgi:CRP/FNR family transcriptional regulator